MRKQFPDATHLSCVGFNMTSFTKLGSEYICLVGWFAYRLLPGLFIYSCVLNVSLEDFIHVNNVFWSYIPPSSASNFSQAANTSLPTPYHLSPPFFFIILHLSLLYHLNCPHLRNCHWKNYKIKVIAKLVDSILLSFFFKSDITLAKFSVKFKQLLKKVIE